MSEWISVDDRLPDIYEEVLVYADSEVRYCKYIANKFVFEAYSSYGDCDDEYFNATHWMPLPSPPEGEYK